MPDKASLITELEIAYVEFRDLVSMLPDDAFQRGGLGDWTLAQLLAHMGGWYREVSLNVASANPHPVSHYEAEDEWNARFVAEARYGMTALDDFDEAFHAFYATLKGMPDALFASEDGAGSGLLGGVGLLHFAEHRPAIEIWLQQ